MVSVNEIGWASYKQFEGPFYRGSAPFRLPRAPTDAELMLSVITATEGGHFDSYNGYDACDCTLGLIQWCDHGQYSVCDMLGDTAAVELALLDPLFQFLDAAPFGVRVAFRQNRRGRWRYFFGDTRGEVDRSSEQDQLYHLHSSGRRGTWDDESRQYAREFAAALASVYEQPKAQRAQVQFTLQRLRGFVLRSVRGLFDSAPDTGLGRAFQASFLSFAANNPTWAAKYLQRAALSTRAEAYSERWLIEVLRELTFGPGVVIYPHRYNCIRPVLERHYGVDLPDMAAELEAFEQDHGAAVSAKGLQKILLDGGYDLGPAGADGNWGHKTRAAMGEFQQQHGLPVTGCPDGPSRDMLFALRDALLDVDGGDDVDARTRRRIKALVGTTIANAARRAVNDIERSRRSAES